MSTSLWQSFDTDTAKERNIDTHKIHRHIQLQIQLQLKIQILLQITWIAYVTWQKKAINKDGRGQRNGDKHSKVKDEKDKRQAEFRLKAEGRRQTTSITWTNFAITKLFLSLSPYWNVQKVCQSLCRFVYQVFFCVFCKLLIPLFHLFLSSLPSFGFVMQTTFMKGEREVRGTCIKSWVWHRIDLPLNGWNLYWA